MADQVIQQIRDRLDIVDVISGYIQVKRAGTNFKASCPFHHEKSPSLVISQPKQIWHCFGCGEGGDIFGFVMRYEKLEFKEVLKLLAQKAGVVLETFKANPQAHAEKEMAIRINIFAAKYYHNVLLSEAGAEARQYLAKRNLTPATIQQWQIGYSPNDFGALKQALLAKNVSLEAMVKAGVAGKNDRSQIYDRFRDRITFPIQNFSGDVVGFSARQLHDNAQSGKYINSPETTIYHKSEILFGLFQAKNAIRDRDTVVIVEGQMDCIQASQAGFPNTVATSGTALTSEQLKLLGRLTKNLYFSFDADSAGQTAAYRAAELALPLGFVIKRIVISGGKDPDELIAKDPKAWQAALDTAPLFIDDYIERALHTGDYDSLEQKQFVSIRLMPLIARIPDPVQRDHYEKKVSQAFNISASALKNVKVQFEKPQSAVEVRSTPEVTVSDNRLQTEKMLFGGMLEFPEILALVIAEGQMADFQSPMLQEIMQTIFQAKSLPEGAADLTIAKEAAFMLESQVDTQGVPKSSLPRELTRLFYNLQLSRTKAEMLALADHLRRAEATRDASLRSSLQQQLLQLIDKRTSLERRLAE